MCFLKSWKFGIVLDHTKYAGLWKLGETSEYSFQKQVFKSQIWIRARGIFLGERGNIIEPDWITFVCN